MNKTEKRQINSRVSSAYKHRYGLYVTAFVYILLLMSCGATGSDINSPAIDNGIKSPAEVNDSNGPTVQLSYNRSAGEKNPTYSFMYFVPLISPTLVEIETDVNNRQQASLVSYEKNITSKSFHVRCEFEMRGDGFLKNRFNAPEIIAICLGNTKPGDTMTSALDYIKFEGEGLGCIEIRGKITGSKETVTEVDVHFNTGGRKSPVTIGLYSIDPDKDGQYKYEDRYNELVARVATLTFRKCDGEPTMGVKVVSVNKATKRNGVIGRIKGMIANFFIDPPTVSRIGNETMLNFGYALFKEKPAFTFPRATNLMADKTATAGNSQ